MQLTHRFRLPADLTQSWSAVNQIDWISSCFPGAKVAEVHGDRFTGSVKVKLGPLALVYVGGGHYRERNEDRHRVVLETSGDDRRGHGSLGTTVTLRLTEAGPETDVELTTKIALTGRPGQLGEPAVTDAADKAVAQFADCLAARFGSGLFAPAPGPDEPEDAQTDELVDSLDGDETVELGAVPGDIEDVERLAAAPARASEPLRPRSFAYAPPADLSETDLQVVRTILKRFGPALAVVTAAAGITVAVIRQARRGR